MSFAVDIVIPSAGRADDLLRLLASLEHCSGGSLSAWCRSITVTDDRPSPDIAARVRTRFPHVAYVAGPARGPAANRNNGAGLGGAEWIWFLDDDCYLGWDALAVLERTVAAPGRPDVVEGAIRPVGERPNGNHHAPINTTGGYLWSCNLLVRRSLFAAVGRFDERFPFACMEDVDLHGRLQAEGARIAFAAEAAVFHPWRSISRTEVSRSIISHAIYAEKNPDFAAAMTLRNALRLFKGRLGLYGRGGPAPIPSAKYWTVFLDLAAPLALYAVTRQWSPLRRSLSLRYRNGPPRGSAA